MWNRRISLMRPFDLYDFTCPFPSFFETEVFISSCLGHNKLNWAKRKYKLNNMSWWWIYYVLSGIDQLTLFVYCSYAFLLFLFCFEYEILQLLFLFHQNCWQAMTVCFVKNRTNITDVSLRLFKSCHGQSEGDTGLSATGQAVNFTGNICVLLLTSDNENVHFDSKEKSLHRNLFGDLANKDFLSFKKWTKIMRVFKVISNRVKFALQNISQAYYFHTTRVHTRPFHYLESWMLGVVDTEMNTNNLLLMKINYYHLVIDYVFNWICCWFVKFSDYFLLFYLFCTWNIITIIRVSSLLFVLIYVLKPVNGYGCNSCETINLSHKHKP